MSRVVSSVEVPIHVAALLKKSNIYECQEWFENKRDEAKDDQEKKNYDKCGAVLKWAATCGGSLDKVSNNMKEKKIIFEFGFSEMQAKEYFEEKLEAHTRV